LVLLACAQGSHSSERKHVASILRNQLGDAAEPEIALARGGSNLLVQVATWAFPFLGDSVLAPKSRELALIALRNYDARSELDSITVIFREQAGTGVWWVRYQRGFAVADLGSNAPDQQSLAAASDAYFVASRSGNTARADSLLAEEHVFVGPTGKVQDKAMRIAWLKENQDWLPSVTTRGVQVSRFGPTGRVSGIWLIPDSGKTVLERFTHIWVLRNGRWQMISHQVTVIPPG
jgi:hypothetical protein